MLIIYPWTKSGEKYYFFNIDNFKKNVVNWKKLRKIIILNDYCKRFCEEFDASFFIYSPGDEIPENVTLKFDKFDFPNSNNSYYSEVDRILQLHPEPTIKIRPWCKFNNKTVFMIPKTYIEIITGIDYIFENNNTYKSQDYKLNYYYEKFSPEYYFNIYNKKGNNYVSINKKEYELIGFNFKSEDTDGDCDFLKFNKFSYIKTDLGELIKKYFHGFIVIENITEDLIFHQYIFKNEEFTFRSNYSDINNLEEEILKQYMI